MDATRPRRTRNSARQNWYAHWRSVRFARHMGFRTPTEAPQSESQRDSGLDCLPASSSMVLSGGLLCYATYLSLVWRSWQWASLVWRESEQSQRRAA